MATPRVFISSTCYDLQEIRFQLRRFMEDIGYEPVMSDFGDIFFDLGQHAQDACKEEISKSNIFVLVIGNNYGTIYHKHDDDNYRLPDSVTLQEFRKALEVGIPKYIFINRFVQHDFENYRRTFSKYMAKYFSENEVDNIRIEETKEKLKEEYDLSYPFPQDAYKYVFYFLDIIYSLDINNAIYPFESFEDIRDNLKKQWAGFFYDALTKETTVALEKVEGLEKKLEKIETHLKLLVDSVKKTGDKNKVTIDIGKLTSELSIENLKEIQEKIDSLLNKILIDNDYGIRLKFREKFDEQKSADWLGSLEKIVHDYKWSKYVPINEIIKQVPFTFWKERSEVPHAALLELVGIVNSLSKEDRKLLLNTIIQKFNEFFEKEPEQRPF